MTLPVVFTANGPSGYNLTKSLRFRNSATAYLNRTPASAGSLTTWTYSAWVKRGLTGYNSGAYQTLLGYPSGGGANEDICSFGAINDDVCYFYVYSSGYVGRLITSQLFRDPSAWYHMVFVWDTTNATSTDRMRLYVNGTRVTAFSTASYPSLNAQSNINSAAQQNIGRYNTSGTLDGYLTEVNFIDGQALTPSSFGSTNALTGVWQPAKYTGTYGTNGFYLPFTDVATTSGSNAGLGKDFSGNGNYWTTNNISVTAGTTYDSMNDVPTLTSATTANYCVLNPLEMLTGMNLTQGNLYTVATSGYDTAVKATMPVPLTGKYYWEILDVSQGNRGWMGLYHTNKQLTSSLIATTPYDISYGPWDGKIYVQSGTASGTYSTSTTNDIVMFAVDADNGKLYVGKNGTWFNSGVPASGTGFVASLTSGQQYSPWFGETGGTVTTVAFNFGQRPFSYTPPTGFVALNTYNLPTSTIVKGNTVMDATLYAGTSVAQSITNAAGFKPDLVWGKNRTSINSHRLTDSVRGTGLVLFSDTTNGDTTGDGQLSSFNSNGFGLTGGAGAFEGLNESGKNYVGWQWQAGQGTTSSNTSGSITSTVSVNASAGFSVVTYTGTGSNATVGHGLGVAPAWVIVKGRNVGSTNWFIYTATQGATKYLDFSSGTGGTDSSSWNNTAPTSSVFSVGSSYYTNYSATTYVAYCWTPIAGYSAFGGFTGNGSTDGPFIYTGFRPKFVMIKRTDFTGDWTIVDTSRNPYNYEGKVLAANTSDAETADTYYGGGVLDGLSNGFKIRNGSGPTNPAGGTCIYMAFAENPFKNALAR